MKIIIEIAVGCICFGIGVLVDYIYYKRQYAVLNEYMRNIIDKNKLLYYWLYIEQHNKSISQWLEEKGYHSVGIYGMGELGERVYDELSNNQSTNISCVIAKDKKILIRQKIYFPDEELPSTDIIIVIDSLAFEKIQKELSKKVNCPIVSLDSIIFSLF